MEKIDAVILAGGRGARMGGNKPTALLAGEPLLAHVWRRVRPQANRVLFGGAAQPVALSSQEQENAPWVEDALPDRQGPLSGVLGAMNWLCVNAPETRFLLTTPCDAPFLPLDLAARLFEAGGEREDLLRCAASAERIHPLIALWPLALRDALDRAVRRDGVRKVFAWLNATPHRVVSWPCAPIDPFFNVNALQDLAVAETMIRAASPN